MEGLDFFDRKFGIWDSPFLLRQMFLIFFPQIFGTKAVFSGAARKQSEGFVYLEVTGLYGCWHVGKHPHNQGFRGVGDGDGLAGGFWV